MQPLRLAFTALLLMLLLFNGLALAEKPVAIPEPLQAWEAWVLQDETDYLCSLKQGAGNKRNCIWPSRLALQLDANGGSFTQMWTLEKESWISLPGDNTHWPHDVLQNEQPLTVVPRKGRPAVLLPPGRHQLSGRLRWQQLPSQLQIPKSTAIVDLTLNGEAVVTPTISEKGLIWLASDNVQTLAQAEKNTLDLRVYRRIVDSHPMQIDTRLELTVGGLSREIDLPDVLLEQAIPVRVKSALAAQLTPDGQLKLQLKPGRWTVDMTSRMPGETTTLQPRQLAAPWPAHEIWLFEAQPQLRQVEVNGATPIDVRQEQVNPKWQHLPGWRVTPEDGLELNVLQRGIQESEPPQLKLRRQLWMDFDAQGYSVRDQISGTLKQNWRLESGEGLALGQVIVDGQPQFITRDQDKENTGVEIRSNDFQLVADSRYETAAKQFPVTGWDADFQQVAIELNLPPGWSLFHVQGVDNLARTWLLKWSLLDLFIILVAAIAIGRLWGWPWGVVALVAFGLSWHEPGAPRGVWLNLIIASAIFTLLPTGRLRQLLGWYRSLAWVLLLVVALPFLIQQAKTSAFPQLERPWQGFSDGSVNVMTETLEANAVEEEMTMMPAPEPAQMDQQMAEPLSKGKPRISSSNIQEVYGGLKNVRKQLNNAPGPAQLQGKLQTGPGLPNWQWQPVTFEWNGPVARDQQVRLILLDPVANAVMKWVQILLLIQLILRLLRVRLSGRHLRNNARQASSLVLLVLLALPQVQADMPTPELLEELKTRLLAPPECLPDCATISSLHIENTQQQLNLTLEAHASEAVAIPLPLTRKLWPNASITLNDEPADSLQADEAGVIWIALKPGRHAITVSANLAHLQQIQLPLPLKPYHVSSNLKGWWISGLQPNGKPDATLHLGRIETQAEASTQEEGVPIQPTSSLPVFARLTRTIHLGLDWHISNTVEKVASNEQSLALEIPLLAGETLLTEGLEVRDGKVRVNLGKKRFSWQSRLAQTDQIVLQTDPAANWTETWQLEVEPWWHVGYEGLTPVLANAPTLKWQPWPGEAVTVQVSRPDIIAGQELTIDRSHLTLQPGKRVTEATLSLTLRSSQGGRHEIRLPVGAQLQQLYINGNSMPLQHQHERVSLPLTPGEHQIKLQWREPRGIDPLFTVSQIDFGATSVNSNITLHSPRDRWILFAWGPRMGPAVIFWGAVVILLIAALVLGRLPLTPLRAWHWFLLLIGLSQIPSFMGVIVVGWFFVLGARAHLKNDISPFLFNLTQLSIAVLTCIALGLLAFAVQQGLLGLPEMQIAGNRSNATELNWYQDRIGEVTPQAWVFSVSIWFYRFIMLAWALWLAFSVLNWLRWGWRCFSENGIWKTVLGTKVEKAVKAEKK